ncbi:MAG TPA: amino acid ABC transporter substrate-binding protein [Burkholderiaceae bacterium]
MKSAHRPFAVRLARRLTALFAVASLGLAVLLPASSHAAETLRFCYERIDVPPWRYVDGTGLHFDLLNRVAKRLDINFELQPLPWKRCMENLKGNLVNGAFAVSFKPDRLPVAVYPGLAPGASGLPDANLRIGTDRYVLVRRRGGNLDWDGQSLQNLNGAIGVQADYSIGTQLRALGATVDDNSQNLRELMMKLAAGRLAGAAILGSANSIFLARNPQLAAQLETRPLPLVEKPYYLVLSHAFVANRPELAARIWKTIETVRKSPEYRKTEQDAHAAGSLRVAGPPG